MSKEEQLKAMQEAEELLEKQFKSKSVLQKLGSGQKKLVPSLSTNLPNLDYNVLGCGGFPRGRVVEVYGPESSGKTALCLHTIAQVQKAGGVAAFIDAEHALSPQFAETLGVDLDELFISQPDCGEQALEIAETLVDKQACDLIVIDSVSALVPRAELEGDMGDSHMGLQARLMSQAMRKLVGKVSKKGVTVIFINQVREKVGLVFGNPEVTTGGRALKFFASVRIEVRRVAASKNGLLKDGTDIVGHKVAVKAVKNKVAAPFKETEIELYYDTGFASDTDLIEYAKSVGIVEGGAWLTVKGIVDKKFRYEELPLEAIKTAVNAYIQETYEQTVIPFDESELDSEEG